MLSFKECRKLGFPFAGLVALYDSPDIWEAGSCFLASQEMIYSSNSPSGSQGKHRIRSTVLLVSCSFRIMPLAMLTLLDSVIDVWDRGCLAVSDHAFLCHFAA